MTRKVSPELRRDRCACTGRAVCNVLYDVEYVQYSSTVESRATLSVTCSFFDFFVAKNLLFCLLNSICVS
jgi:hypothetical protein